MPRPPLAGVVLAGGQSRRMGRDKALMTVAGEPMVLRVAARLAKVADPVVVATGVVGRLGPLGYREVADAGPGIGPLAGLLAGLAASPHRLCAAVAVDLPFASPAVLSLLADAWAGEDAVVPLVAGRLQPLHAVYFCTAGRAMEKARDAGQRRLLAVLEDLEVRIVPEAEWAPADPTASFAVNLNRPEDLEALGLLP